LISTFRHVLNAVWFLLGNSPASEFCMRFGVFRIVEYVLQFTPHRSFNYFLFQNFVVFWILYAFFRVISLRLNFICLWSLFNDALGSSNDIYINFYVRMISESRVLKDVNKPVWPNMKQIPDIFLKWLSTTTINISLADFWLRLGPENCRIGSWVITTRRRKVRLCMRKQEESELSLRWYVIILTLLQWRVFSF
jgi:hypothetical protein